MTVGIEIKDIFPDGTITEVSFGVPLIISLTVKRSYPDEPFVIVNCEVPEKDEKKLSDAVGMIISKMKEMDIDLLIPIVNNQVKSRV